MAESSLNGWKTLWKKEKLLIIRNFSFSHCVFKRLVFQTLKNQGLFGKGLTSTSHFRIQEEREERHKIKRAMRGGDPGGGGGGGPGNGYGGGGGMGDIDIFDPMDDEKKARFDPDDSQGR